MITIASIDRYVEQLFHVQDMDSVGLITAEIEADLPAELRGRLQQIRAIEYAAGTPAT